MSESWNDILFDPGTSERASQPEKFFGRSGPLAVEIGFGSGEFLDALGAARPEWNLIGAEISAACHRRAFERLRRRKRRNVRLFKGTGEFLVREVLPPASVRTTFVNFPDPWPKSQHRGRRLLTTEFLRTLAGRLERQGELRLTTDHEEYFEWAVDQSSAVPALEVTVEEPPADVLGTKYARKWQHHGRDFHHARFARVRDADWVPPKVERVDEMHHAKLQGFIPESIQPFDRGTRQFDGGIVAIVGTYTGVDDSTILCLAHVQEPDLTQKILVEISAGEEAARGREIMVRVRRFNEPLMSRGTSEAVDYVAEWVADFDDRNRIVERKY